MKRCPKCGQTKPHAGFHRSRSNRDGLASHCKPCRLADNQAYRAGDPERVRAIQAAWYAANREKTLARVKLYREADPEAFRARRKAWYAANREKINATARAYRAGDPERARAMELAGARRRKYGLTVAQYDQMMVDQDGTCANPGCDNPPTDVDHDHDTGIVRGLLCSGCNCAEGLLGSDPERISGLVAYVLTHQKSEAAA